MSTIKASKRIRPHSSLAAWRRFHGFSQHDAARVLGISQSYYSKLETHEQSPRRAMMKALTAKTGVPVDALMGLTS
jgi:transcriptional regulator with XRE-family HTH domain